MLRVLALSVLLSNLALAQTPPAAPDLNDEASATTTLVSSSYQIEVERVLALPHVVQARGLRDRAMLEIFYAIGLRRMEVAKKTLALGIP